MSNYNHMLLATDLAPDCQEIAEKALAIARSNSARFSIVHVLEAMPVYMYSYMETTQLEKEITTEARNQMTKLCEMLSIPVCDSAIEMGPTKHAILQKATDLGVDLIIVGSHGRHGLSKLLGSTANAVLHGAKCDVLTLRYAADKS